MRFMWTLLLLTALLGLLQSGDDAPLRPAEPKGIVIPLDYDPLTQPLPTVRVRVNGNPPLPFTVDTGDASHMTVTDKARERLKLPWRRRFRPTAGEVAVVSVEVLTMTGSPPLRLPVTKAQCGDFAVDDDTGEEPAAGMIGSEALERYVARFDLDAKTLTLYERDANIAPPPGAQRVPLVRMKDLPGLGGERLGGHRGVRVLSLGGKNLDLPLLLDTGATDTCLPRKLQSQAEPLAIAERDKNIKSISALWGTASGRAKVLLLDRLEVGPLSEPSVGVTFYDMVGERIGVLGMNVLSRYRFTIDFPNDMLYLEKRPTYAELMRPPGYLGLRMAWDEDEGYSVDEVSPGSPEAVAGLRAGDCLLSIDGQELRRLLPGSVSRLFGGYTGTQAKVVVEREGLGGFKAKLTISIPREPAFRPRPKPDPAPPNL